MDQNLFFFNLYLYIYIYGIVNLEQYKYNNNIIYQQQNIII